MRKKTKKLEVLFIIAILSSAILAQSITINQDSLNSKTKVNYRGINIGENAEKINLEKVFNASQTSISLKDLKNKIVIFEFWATWCGPCFPAIEHLKKLKEKFPDQLEVISVMHESEERLQRYMKNNPSLLWHIADPDMKLNEYFPHRAIPHTVVIDKNGKVAAITSPNEITEEVISKLIKGQSVNLTEKNDGLNESFDITKDYFPKPENTEYSFDLQPPIPNGFSMNQRRAKGIWTGRRITLINQPILNIYKTLFNFNEVRTIYEGIDKAAFQANKKFIFSIDVIVPKGKESELYSYAQKELMALDFEVKAKIDKRKMDVGVLTCFDKEKLLIHQSNKPPRSDGVGLVNASQYKRIGVSLDEMLRGFLEGFGHGRMPLVNETNIDGLFDFDIELDLEDKSTLKNSLEKYGLRLSKEEREVEVLVIFPGR